MKTKYILLYMLFLSVHMAKAQTYHCLMAGHDRKFEMDTTKIMIKFTENYPIIKRNELLKDLGINPLKDEKEIGSYTIFTLRLDPKRLPIEKLLTALSQKPEIEMAFPFLRHNGNSDTVLSNDILIKVKTFADTLVLQKVCKEQQLTLLQMPKPDKENLHNSLSYVAIARFPREQLLSAFTIIKKLQDTQLFTYVEPNFIIIRTQDRCTQDSNSKFPELLIPKKATAPTYTPNDPLFPNQWGFPAADVTGAWNVAQGIAMYWSSNIKVAIVDEGVDLTHPDLVNSLLPGFDATYGVIPWGANPYDSAGGCTQYDPHGTAMAGTVAAQHNTIGIAGVSKSRILPVRESYTINGGGSIGSNYMAARGIIWSYVNGADVINCSWGGGAESTELTDAIEDAASFGRGGLGTAVLCAAPNSPTPVDYPGIIQKSISVTATETADYKHSNSGFGYHLDVGAPGTNIVSTDLSGYNGYNTGDYASKTGTSLATAFASGVMALIFGAKPGLTLSDARFILESTCDKTGNYVYTNTSFPISQPNGTWSMELGYGRINARKAVQLALTTVPGSTVPLPYTFSYCSAQYAQNFMRDANNSGLSASVNFKINNRVPSKVINVCNGNINLNPIDRWLFTMDESNILCSRTSNMGPAALKVKNGILKNKCNCRWLRLFIAVMECDENLNPIAAEAYQWFYFHDNDQSTISETKNMRTFNLNNYLPNGVSLQDGKYYKIKVASFDNGDYTQSWCERSAYVRTYKDILVIQNKAIVYDEFASKITILNATAPPNKLINVVAKSEIRLKANSKLSSGHYKIKQFDCSQLDQFNH